MAKARRRKRGGGRKRGGLAKASIAELHAEIRRRQSGLGRLQRQRQKLMTKLASVEREIAARDGDLGSVRLAGRGRAGGRKRPRNDSNLVEALKKVLSGKTMSVTDVAGAVQKAGYRTTSPNFRTIVNQTLLKKTHFRRVGRGKYTAK